MPHSMSIDFTFSVEFTGKCTRTSFSFNFAAVAKNFFHCITCKLFYSLKCVTMQLAVSNARCSKNIMPTTEVILPTLGRVVRGQRI